MLNNFAISRCYVGLQGLAKKITLLNEYIGNSLAWLTLAMVLITCAIVLLRYGFNLGWIALQESVNYMHAAVFMLAAAYTLKHNAHVRVDIFYRKQSPRRQAIIDIGGDMLLLIPVSGFLIWISSDYVMAAWRINEASAETGGLPGVYLLKTLIPVMAGLLMLQAIANIIQRCAVFFESVDEFTEENQ